MDFPDVDILKAVLGYWVYCLGSSLYLKLALG